MGVRVASSLLSYARESPSAFTAVGLIFILPLLPNVVCLVCGIFIFQLTATDGSSQAGSMQLSAIIHTLLYCKHACFYLFNSINVYIIMHVSNKQNPQSATNDLPKLVQFGSSTKLATT